MCFDNVYFKHDRKGAKLLIEGILQKYSVEKVATLMHR